MSVFGTGFVRKVLGLKPRIRRAAVYRRDNRVVLCPESETTAGVWIPASPVVVGAPEPGDLGRQLIHALEASKSGVGHPSVWTGLFDPVLQAAGVPSRAAFMQSAVRVGVSWNATGVELTPCRNLGTKEGFDEIASKAMLLPTFTHEQLGAALLSALDNAMACAGPG